MDKCTECGQPFSGRNHSPEFSDEHFWHWYKRDNSPMLTAYDKANVDKILNGEGDWFSAHVLRFLDKVIWNADSENLIRLWNAFPEHCKAL